MSDGSAGNRPENCYCEVLPRGYGRCPSCQDTAMQYGERVAKLEFELRELVNTVKRVTIESCAKIAAGHNGISPKDSRDIATKIRLLSTINR